MSKKYVVYVTEQDKEFFVTQIRWEADTDMVTLPEDEERKLIKRMGLKPAFSKRKTVSK
jgi:hypothetical protein